MSRRLRFASAVILLAVSLLLVYRYWRSPERPQIFTPVDGVSEITLQFDPTNKGSTRGPVMGLGYARWVNFARVMYEGEVFRQVGSGASLITRDAQPTRYVVREGYRLKPGPFGTLRYATLVVQDTKSNALVASNEWLCDANECRYTPDGEQGWPGQHAALFVRKALNPAMPIGGNVGTKPYPRTVATLERRTPSTPLARAKLTSRSFGCPDDLQVYVRKDINQMVVARPGWSFVAPHQTRQVHCTAEGLFVFSTTFPSEIFLDWLSPEGELRGQYNIPTIEFPTSGGGTFPFLADVVVRPETFELRMAYFHDRWPAESGGALLPQWELAAKVSRTESAHRHAP